ncbi:DUF2922 domain-containing protein [uncultured Phascolarctobacterium sp.]|uniref:DUF2922 domain-containing protein n=2 Tax=uncultured Phascolarctobacterium sp. TaxID=512296 RepID=UPI0035A64907
MSLYEDVTPDEAQTAMQVLIDNPVFDSASGELAEIAESWQNCRPSAFLIQQKDLHSEECRSVLAKAISL